ncbi:MAG: hypothetical protein ACTH36_09165 [Pseudoalteromonas nigrifaciens]|uniref:hypothetical protein n=1 Tax=Pseudoalteromonas nigrifaciens TaxID=28109 RepID=UPI0017879236|nr:hypothetical protein [Pseudoalteromonas nigrifaciens]MBE0421330.1 hypothetical protein [Pseudoalteromonas nigrifaciens]
MKLTLIIVTAILVSFSVSAKDNCSSQLQGYIAGLEVGATLSSFTKHQRDRAIKQIDYIEKLQENLPDCEVVNLIPELKATKDALNFATEKMKDL